MLNNEELYLFNKRDRKAFESVFDYYHNVIYIFVCKKINDEPEARDITMKVFMDLHKSSETFRSLESLNAYLYRLAINRCLNFLKAQERQRARNKELMVQSDDNENNNSQIPNDIQVIAVLTEIINKLPGKYGQVARYLYNNYTYQQIADMLNISLDMVYKLRDYAVKRIRQRLRGI
jgi:RNA polymerase sigma factor (sigma-70 family)